MSPDVRSILVAGIRIVAVLFGGFLVVQGVATAGFVAILGLFFGSAAETTQVVHLLGLVALGAGMTVVGLWLVYAGARNFPHLRSRIPDSLRFA